MLIDIVEALMTGDDLCISVPNTEFGRMISAYIEDYIIENPDQFDKCLVFDEKSSQE